MPSEFDLIQRYFSRRTQRATLGVGDDAALLPPAPGMELAVSVDTLVCGKHFFAETDPQNLGWKCLAVNISDMAAMGAIPRWALLALTLPEINEPWLAEFAKGIYACADTHDMELVGGDTTSGPLTISITIMGEVPPGMALRRDGAHLGDDIWVSGWLGTAALGLTALQGKTVLPADALAMCRAALERPVPRVALGLALRNVATAAIDISDGLLADLGHILERSHCGAELQFDSLPAHPTLTHLLDQPWARNCLLAGGDDYELCFTAPKHRRGEISAISDRLQLSLTRIGSITSGNTVRVLNSTGEPMTLDKTGYDHFA